MKHAAPGDVRLREVGKQAHVGRPHLPTAVPRVVEAIEEVIRPASGALGDDDGLRAVLVDDLAHLLLDEVECLVPRDAFPLVFAPHLRVGLVHAPTLPLQRVLQAVRMGVDFLGGERFDAQDSLGYGLVRVAFHADDVVVVIHRQNDATLGVTVEACRPYLFLHCLPPTFFSPVCNQAPGQRHLLYPGVWVNPRWVEPFACERS